MTFHFRTKQFATFTFVVKDMFNIESKTSKDFLTSFSNCHKIFKYIVICIFKYILILLMGNIKCYHKTVFTIYSNKDKKKSKQNKTFVKIHESL